MNTRDGIRALKIAVPAVMICAVLVGVNGALKVIGDNPKPKVERVKVADLDASLAPFQVLAEGTLDELAAGVAQQAQATCGAYLADAGRLVLDCAITPK